MKFNKPYNALKSFFLTIILIGLTSCSGQTTQQNFLGGSEAGNPPTQTVRSLTGALSFLDTALELSISPLFEDVECDDFSVKAIDEVANELSVNVNSDCTFALALLTGHYYRIDIFQSGKFYAKMLFDNGEGQVVSEIFRFDDAENAMQFGMISFLDGIAIAEFSPASQNDEDGDGIPDAEDDDASVRSLPDCDEDGLPDLFESEADICSSNDAVAEFESETETQSTPEPTSEPISETIPEPVPEEVTPPDEVSYTIAEATAGGPFDCDGDGVNDSDFLCILLCADGTVIYNAVGELIPCD